MFDGSFRVLRSPRRKRIGFRVDDTGVLEVHAPATLSEARLRQIISASTSVIERAYAAYERRPLPLQRTYCEGELFPFWGKALPLVFSERLRIICNDAIMVPRGTPLEVRESLEKLYRREAPAFLLEKCRARGASRGLLPDSVGVTGAVTRWGSCSSSGHISFCWKILLLPEELADYILCHELAHLRHLDHSAAFWRLTEELAPNALAKRKKLRELPELWPLPSYKEL